MTLAARLRHALEAGARREIDLIAGDYSDMGELERAPAAVLVAFTDRPEPGVILTQRTATLRKHAGQVAFPGGRIDPADADPVAAALREAEEEIGLPRDLPEIVGVADVYHTRTGYLITPVLAVVPPDLPFVAHEHEVDAIFEVPMARLFDPGWQAPRHLPFEGAERTYHELMWGDHRIWGVTAAIIVNLSRRLVALPA